jgi:hypothetical protein
MPDCDGGDGIMPPHVIDAMILTTFFGLRRGEVFA